MREDRPPTPQTEQHDGSLHLDRLEAVTLQCLVGQPAPVPLAELANRLIGLVDHLNDTKRLKVRLHHLTLPQLANNRLLAYDPDEQVITPYQTETDYCLPHRQDP